MEKTRGLLPQTVLLNLLNRIIIMNVGPLLDSASVASGVHRYILGATKGNQTQDITFSCAQVLEKGRDRHNAAAVAQADIAKFHDCVPWGFTLKALIGRSVPIEWACAALRVHRMPKVHLRVGRAATRVLERTRGVLTGAASSGMLARLAIEDTFLAAMPQMEPLAFDIDESRMLLGMSWSDNLFTFAESRQKACQMMGIWASYLWSMCGLLLKDDSQEIVQASSKTYREPVFEEGGVSWKVLPCLTTLGHSISCTGGQSEDRRRVRNSWEAAFWRNARVLTCQRIPVQSRLRFWKMLSQGIGMYRYSMWTPLCSAARSVQAGHNKILHRMVRVQMQDGEPKERYCRRRNRAVADHAEGAGIDIISDWSLSLVRWLEHLQRHPDMPANVLVWTQDDLWLQALRALHPSATTGTRSGPGKPLRWSESWVASIRETLGLENAERDKMKTRERAMLVQIVLQYGRLHGRDI